MELISTIGGVQVRTDGYEGPFELILDLIEKRKLSVNDLSLSQVTDDYIQYVRSQGSFPMEEAAQFIGIAATLLLIKSKSLVPDLELTDDEEEDVDDLKRRLLYYEKVRSARQELARVYGKDVLVEAGARIPEPLFTPARDFSIAVLSDALRGALTALAKEAEALPVARVRPLVTIEEMMDTLLTRVQKTLTLSFAEFSGDTKERIEIIVTFLALLELVKEGAVEAHQHESFADIRISDTSTSVPHY